MGKDIMSSQFLLFHSGGKIFGIPLNKIIEIKRKLLITRIPNAPSFVIGVSNLRGRITPLVYFHDLLKEASMENTGNSSYIILDISGNWVGIEVDFVSEVLRHPQDKISPYEGTSSLIRNCSYGIIKHGGAKILLLDPEKLINEWIESK